MVTSNERTSSLQFDWKSYDATVVIFKLSMVNYTEKEFSLSNSLWIKPDNFLIVKKEKKEICIKFEFLQKFNN